MAIQKTTREGNFTKKIHLTAYKKYSFGLEYETPILEERYEAHNFDHVIRDDLNRLGTAANVYADGRQINCRSRYRAWKYRSPGQYKVRRSAKIFRPGPCLSLRIQSSGGNQLVQTGAKARSKLGHGVLGNSPCARFELQRSCRRGS